MRRELVDHLASIGKTLEKVTNEGKVKIEKQLREVEILLSDTSAPEEVEKLALLQRKKSLEDKLSRQINMINNPPNFHPELITFVSSTTKEGYDKLERNLVTAVEKISSIQLQDQWADKITSLLTDYEDQPFIRFDDFLKDKPKLPQKEVIALLVGLNAIGRVIWSPHGHRKFIIFHKVENLAFIVKSIFHHEMNSILNDYADLKKLDIKELLAEKYEQGLLPLELIQSMFFHICERSEGKDFTIKMSYADLQICSADIESNQVFDSFFELLKQFRIVKVVNQTLHSLQKWGYVPFLVSQKPEDIDEHIWNKIPDKTKVAMELGLLLSFDTLLSKSTFSQCCTLSIHVSEVLAKMIGSKLDIISRVGAQIVKFANFEILLQHLTNAWDKRPWPYPEKQFLNTQSGLLVILRSTSAVCAESAWIIFHELVSKLLTELESFNGDPQLICPREVTGKECNHGDMFPDVLISSERVESEPRMKKKYTPKCKNCPSITIDLRSCFPSQVAIDIIDCLKARGTESPFAMPTPPDDVCLDISNILTTISKQQVDKLSEKIKNHPIHLSSKEKFFIVRAVRQWFDNMEKCEHQKCRCYLSQKAYVECFAFLEQNGCIVTNGDWSTTMKPILDKYEKDPKLSGNCSSATALVRAYRNAIAHSDPENADDPFLKDMEKAFRWAIMHFFNFKERMIPGSELSLEEFALAFEEFQTATCKKYLEEGVISYPVNPLFWVIVFPSTDDAKAPRESLFYANPDRRLEVFKKEISDRFRLPVDDQIVKYMGNYEPGVKPDVDKAVEVKDTETFSSLSLDSKFTHLFHITERKKRKINVQITLVREENEEICNSTFFSNESLEKVYEYLHGETKSKSWLLLSQEKKATEKKAKFHSMCEGDVISLIAFDQKIKDEEKRKKYLP